MIMPGIKYSPLEEPPVGAEKIGNFIINPNAVGPTSETGYYSTIDIPNNGYVIYVNKEEQGPSIFPCISNTNLIFITNNITGENFTSVAQCTSYFSANTNTALVGSGSSIPSESLQLFLNAGDFESYPGSGSTWYDISGNNNDATLFNSPTFSGNSIIFDGFDDYATYNYDATAAMTIITVGRSVESSWSNFAGLGSSRVNNGFIIHNDSGTINTRYFVSTSSGGNTFIEYVFPVSTNVMRVYAMSTNGSNSHKRYLDGTLVGTVTTSITRGSSSNNSGSLARDSGVFDNRYNNVAIRAHIIYNRQLTDSEITEISEFFST